MVGFPNFNARVATLLLSKPSEYPTGEPIGE